MKPNKEKQSKRADESGKSSSSKSPKKTPSSRTKDFADGMPTSNRARSTSAYSSREERPKQDLPSLRIDEPFETYELLPMDTLEGIALKFNVNVDTLKALNGLRTEMDMYTHKVLKVPSSLEDKPLHVAVGSLDDSVRPRRMNSDFCDDREVFPSKSAGDLDVVGGQDDDLFAAGGGFEFSPSTDSKQHMTVSTGAVHPTPPMPRKSDRNALDEGWILTPDANVYGDDRTPVLQAFRTGLHKHVEPSAPSLDASTENGPSGKQEQKVADMTNGDSVLAKANPAKRRLVKKDSKSYALTRSLEIRSSVVVDRGIEREDPTHVDDEANNGLRRHCDYVDETVSPMQETAEDTTWLMEHDAAWSGVILPSTHLEARQKLKFLVRRGIPDRLRTSVWLLITGAADFLAENPDYYHQCLHRTFGDNIPDKFFQVPTFGGELRPADHFLTQKGLIAARRILCTLASNHADIEYVPVMPDLVCLLLTFMSEADTYTTVHCLYLASRNPKEHISYFVATKKEVHVFLYTFEDILKKKERKLGEKMKALGVTSHNFADAWFMRLFLGTFPFQAVLRFFDAYLGEGRKIMYRIAIALMKACKADLLAAQTKEDFVGVLQQRAAQTPNPTVLLKRAFELQLQRKEFHRYNEKNRAKVLHVMEPKIPVYYKPIIRTPSKIISDLQFELLYTWLPSRFGIEDPVQRYSSSQEGYSLRYFMEKMGNLRPGQRSPTIFLIRTTLGEVFGAFLGYNANWQFSKGRDWTGERDCFLWTFVPEPAKYGWYDGCDSMFLHVERSRGISIGGGNGTGLYLDAEMMNGSTQKCDTFKNLPLTGDRREDFELAAFEVYGFE